MEEFYEKHKLLIWGAFMALCFLPWTGYAMMALVFGGMITVMATMVAGTISGNPGAYHQPDRYASIKTLCILPGIVLDPPEK